jgi:hypothetical protein
MPHHVISTNSLALESNLQPHGCADCQRESVIWLGYTVSKDKSRIVGIYATHGNGDKSWFTDLYEWSGKNQSVEMPTYTPIETPVEPALRTHKKKKKGA